MPVIRAETLQEFATRLLAAGGLDTGEAASVARSLIAANLRGHDSHGVMRIPYYLDRLDAGDVVAGAELTTIRETPLLLAADGNWGFGQTQARRLMERIIPKAQDHGVAVGTLLHSSHVGRLGEYCEMAADAGLISLMMVNTHGAARRVAPVGGKAARLGTNPLAIGVPRGDAPLLLDFGTSAAAEGKVRVKHIAGQACPDGWLLDCDGRPTNDAGVLYREPCGTIRPVGGDQAYKGFALALMVEIFAGALSGGPCIREVRPNQIGNCVFMQTLDPAHLGGSEHVAREVAALAEFVCGCPRIDGVDEILLPGDPERGTMGRRMAEGIPFDEGNWSQLAELAEKLKVAMP